MPRLLAFLRGLWWRLWTSRRLDCQTCGACCIWFFPNGVDVFSYDDVPEALLDCDEQGFRVMAMERGACIALFRKDGRCSCAIYDRRPMVCRDFNRGDERCREIRESLADAVAEGRQPPRVRRQA